MLRGCFLPAEANDPLASGVPTFATTKDALEWSLALARQPSNPAFPTLLHSISTLVGRKQTFELLEPRIRQVTVPRAVFCVCNTSRNRFVDSVVHYGITQRLEAEYHSRLSSESTMNSLMYAFDHMRCGILVQIRSRKIVTFAPFVNDEYRNNWAHKLTTEPTPLETYYAEKLRYYRAENIIDPVSAWWANGNIICNEHETGANKTTQWWGDNLLLPFKHMLEHVCAERDVPDVDFFFNKRDHPQLRANLCEPYDFLFDERDVPLPPQARFSMFAPFVSFYCAPSFADVPCPTNEDWKGCTGLVFAETSIPSATSDPPIAEPSALFTTANFEKFKQSWENKANTAFFRGNATGGGTTPRDNQRLHLAYLGENWKEAGDATLLDAGVTGYNVRDKKLFGQPMRFARKDELPPRASFVPMYEQSKYKYLIYVEGHCAANRYSFLMRLGSVILKVDSTCEARDLWFFPLLKPMDTSRDLGDDAAVAVEADHVAVKADLSNLREVIEWCRRNDAACRTVAANAQRFHERWLSREAVLDYWQLVLCGIGEKTAIPPAWFTPPARGATPAKPTEPSVGYCWKRNNVDKVWCKRCRETLEDEAAHAALSEAAVQSAVAAADQMTPQVVSRISNMCKRCRRDKATACTCN